MLSLKQVFCLHDWDYQGTMVIGVTLDCQLRPTRLKQTTYSCRKCKKLKKMEPHITFKDYVINANHYNENGWPIDENGVRLKITE